MRLGARKPRVNEMERLQMEFGKGSAVATAIVDETVQLAKAPDKKFKAGSLTATVWKGISQKGTFYYNVQLGKSYKDKDNNWKNTNSLMENDVPKAVVLLQKAYEYVISQRENAVLD